MKNVSKLFGIIVLASVMVFSFGGCSNPSGGGGDDSWGNPPVSLTGTWETSQGETAFTVNADGTVNWGAFISSGSMQFKGSQMRVTVSNDNTTVTWSLSTDGNTLTLGDPSSGPLAATLKALSPLSKTGDPQTKTYTGTKDSVTYTLEVTGSTSQAEYTPAAGDAYELSLGADESAGTVISLVGGTFTLKPYNSDETFTITVSGTMLTALFGHITCKNNSIITGPDELNSGDSTEDGSPEHPWLVYDETTLRKVGTETAAGGWTLSAYYKQTDDIPLDSSDPNNWTPIGGVYTFTGSYDGGNHTITGLTITSSSLDQGLFGHMNGGTVKNVKLIDCDYTSSNQYIGGIAGHIIGNGIVDNCYVTGIIRVTSIAGENGAGGVVGWNESGTIKNCVSEVDIDTVTNNAGGIAGRNSSTIINCYSTGFVKGLYGAGGITGWNLASNATVENCYATGDVTGTRAVGGVVGESAGRVTNCYATGIVINTGGDSGGGVVGWNNGGTVQNCIALNLSISSSLYYGRVIGTGPGSVNNARSDMLVNGFPVTTGTGAATLHGADVAVDNTVNLNTLFVTNALFDPDVWNIPAGNLVVGCPLPTLKNMPGLAQNPTLPEIPEL